MSQNRLTPLGAVVRGAAAGAVGTLAMDLLWYVRYRRGGGKDKFRDWELSSTTLSWEEVAAPGEVGRRVLEGFLQRELPDSWAKPTNDLVHVGYGLMWGSLYGLVAGATDNPRTIYGPVLGFTAWISGYVVLPLAKLYKPIWDYDPVTLTKDLTAHLVFGTTTAAVFRRL